MYVRTVCIIHMDVLLFLISSHHLQLFGSEKHNSASYRGILPVLLTQVRGLSLTLSYFTHPDADAYVRAKYTEDEDKCSPFQHWIVLQGPLSSEVVVRICQIVRTGPTMLLNNEDHLVLPGMGV